MCSKNTARVLGRKVELATVTAPDLAKLFKAFFVDIRGKNGEAYKANSLKAARGAIQRFLSASGSKINILTTSSK